jgi:hypothetical protein
VRAEFRCVYIRDYYCYRLQTCPAIFNPILHDGHLFQHFAVDTYKKTEGYMLNWIRDNQQKIHADLCKGFLDSIIVGKIAQALLAQGLFSP